MMILRPLLYSIMILSLFSCGDKESNLAPVWNGVNKKYSKPKKITQVNNDPQIRVTDELLREMAENLFILQENASEELKISEGLTLGATLGHYVCSLGNYTLSAKQIMSLIKGFENLIEKPVDEKIMTVLEQIRLLKLSKTKGKCSIQVFGKNSSGIVYFINERNYDEDNSLKELKFVQVKNGAVIDFTEVYSFSQREELVEFVKDTGKRDSIHKDIPKYIEKYFELESPSPVLKLNFKDFIVRVDTRTMWKNIDFDFKFGWAIPLFRVDDKNIPGFVLFMKKKLAKIKVSVDQ